MARSNGLGAQLVALLLIGGCGVPAASAPVTVRSSDPADITAAATERGPAAATERGPAERTTVLQLALDLPQMDRYWHVDMRPDRMPLRVAPHPDLPDPLGLEKFGEAVVVRVRAPLRFDRIVVEGTIAHVVYHYAPEGLRVDVRLESDGTTWPVLDDAPTGGASARRPTRRDSPPG